MASTNPLLSQVARTAKQGRTNAHEQIREVLEDWADALRHKDADRVLSHYTEDMVQFPLAPPLSTPGADEFGKEELEAWFASFAGPMHYEMSELAITAGKDVAFSRSLNHMSGTARGGGRTDLWFRVTLCLRNTGGQWRIAHEHDSVPFYMHGRAEAAIDLKP